MSVSLYDAFGSLVSIPEMETSQETNSSFCGVSFAITAFFKLYIFELLVHYIVYPPGFVEFNKYMCFFTIL